MKLTLREQHGETSGGVVSKEYSAWAGIVKRCTNPKGKTWLRYGGRGITVCDEWRRSFSAFLRDMGRAPSVAHSVERNDNDAGYSPSNCRWATRLEQVRNRSVVHRIEHAGRALTLKEYCAITGLSYEAVIKRMNRHNLGPLDAIQLRPFRKSLTFRAPV